MESQPPLVKSWHTIRIWIGKMIQSNNESEHLRQKCILGIDPGTNVMGYGLLQVSGNKASLLVMGVIDMRKSSDPYLRLGHIFERVQGIIDAYKPDEMAVEAPFFGKNVQSMLALARCSHRGSCATRIDGARICAHEDKDGAYGPRSSI